MKIIEIVVSPTGATQVQTKGFAGAACRQASEFLEKALGKTAGEQFTSEFHQSVEQPQTQPEGA